jgi:hypothetical protein
LRPGRRIEIFYVFMAFVAQTVMPRMGRS